MEESDVQESSVFEKVRVSFSRYGVSPTKGHIGGSRDVRRGHDDRGRRSLSLSLSLSCVLSFSLHPRRFPVLNHTHARHDDEIEHTHRKFQYYLDKSTVYTKGRWIFFLFLLCLYMLRVYLAQGWYIVTYGLGIYLLNLFIGFLSPSIDPDSEGPGLPSNTSEEFRPFERRVPEFKFWYSASKAVCIATVMTFFSVFDIPVFWPILLLYFFVLFFLTMKRQIKHMWKHNYVPWSHGKKTYKGKKEAVTTAADMARFNAKAT